MDSEPLLASLAHGSVTEDLAFSAGIRRPKYFRDKPWVDLSGTVPLEPFEFTGMGQTVSRSNRVSSGIEDVGKINRRMSACKLQQALACVSISLKGQSVTI